MVLQADLQHQRVLTSPLDLTIWTIQLNKKQKHRDIIDKKTQLKGSHWTKNGSFLPCEAEEQDTSARGCTKERPQKRETFGFFALVGEEERWGGRDRSFNAIDWLINY